MTIESLPPEKRITGRSNSPATSRKMCTASDSSASRCESAYGLSVLLGDSGDGRRHASPLSVSSACSAAADSCTVCVCDSIRRSGSTRAPRTGRRRRSARRSRPPPAWRTGPSHRARSTPRPGWRHAPPGTRCRSAWWRLRTASRLSAYGAMTGTSALTPLRGEQFGDEADALHVGVPVLAAEAEARGEELADLVAVEHLDAVALGAQPLGQRVGDGGLARARQTGEPDGGARSRAFSCVPRSVRQSVMVSRAARTRSCRGPPSGRRARPRPPAPGGCRGRSRRRGSRPSAAGW